MKSFVISENDSGQRVDKFITKAVPMLPKSLLYKYLRTKKIKLNRKRCDACEFLQVGDILEMYINDEFFEDKVTMQFLDAPTELEVAYEDDNIIIVDKPVGLVVHEDNDGGNDTLINRIIHYLYNKNEYNPKTENSFVPALCNRIDRNTTGLVIAAKNSRTLRAVNEAIRERNITKKYLCLVDGVPKKKSDIFECWIKKNSSDNTVSVTEYQTEGALDAKTGYEVLKIKGNISLLKVELFTGRTHQIRAVLAYLGTPILGDSKYGKRNSKYKYQALCSYSLSFHLPDNSPLAYLNGKTITADSCSFQKDID